MIIIEKLTNEEKEVLNKIAKKTKCDRWFFIEEQTDNKNDFIKDIEYNKIYGLKDGVCLLLEAIDCKENWDNCELTEEEKDILFDLCYDLGFENDFMFIFEE